MSQEWGTRPKTQIKDVWTRNNADKTKKYYQEEFGEELPDLDNVNVREKYKFVLKNMFDLK